MTEQWQALRKAMIDTMGTPDDPGYGSAIDQVGVHILSGKIVPNDPVIWNIRFNLLGKRPLPNPVHLSAMIQQALAGKFAGENPQPAVDRHAARVIRAPRSEEEEHKEHKRTRPIREAIQQAPRNPFTWREQHFRSGREFFLATAYMMKHKIMPSSPEVETVAQALSWVDPLNRPDPLKEIPEEDRERFCQAAIDEMKRRRARSSHPFAIRLEARRLYRLEGRDD